MKRVLIITYYWPPSGGAGVQRWLKFVKYLRNFGWEPVVYTPSNPENPEHDESLLKDIPTDLEVIRTPIWEPYQLYKKFIGQKPEQKINSGFLTENEKPKLAEKISVWVRGNFFIPDARVFWVKPSVKYLSAYLQKNKIDAIISTGPPHSMHLIAMELKHKFSIPWLADFRDPWTNIDYYKDLMLSAAADKKHHKLEKLVLQNADEVIVVGNTMANEFEKIAERKINVITNGYDDDDIMHSEFDLDKKFSIAHIGSINKDRNPESLWKALQQLVAENKQLESELEIKLVGKVDIAVINDLEKFGLKKYLRKIEYLPHNEVIHEQQRSQVLLLLLNNTPNAKGILTGKMFEYLAANRPVICIGPVDGDAAGIIQKSGAGVVADFDDLQKIKESIENYFNQFNSGNLNVQSEGVGKYARKNLTSELVELLNRNSKN